jgi:hypothetical protein
MFVSNEPMFFYVQLQFSLGVLKNVMHKLNVQNGWKKFMMNNLWMNILKKASRIL